MPPPLPSLLGRRSQGMGGAQIIAEVLKGNTDITLSFKAVAQKVSHWGPDWIFVFAKQRRGRGSVRTALKWRLVQLNCGILFVVGGR